ncbi:MAG: PAS domain S-box protein [bacterium]|nr:PAS domain S-box protein [bacterium]
MASKKVLSHSGFDQLMEFSKKGSLSKLIIDSSDDAIDTQSLDGIITSWNKGAEKIYGYKAGEILGKNSSILLSPDQPNELIEHAQQIRENQTVPHYETKRIRKDGQLTDVSLALSAIHDEQGKVIGIATISRDITGSTQESQYARSLIEASLDPLMTISTEGKITDMNNATVNITGITREKMTDTDFFDYFTEPQKARQVYEEVFAKGSVADSPLTLRHKNGKLTDVLFNGSVYKDDGGRVLGVVIVARDVTAQKLLSKYSLSLIEASLDPLVTISTEGKITDMNEALANITGMPREKLTGTDFFDYFTEPQKAREVYQEVFAKGSVADSPLTLRHKNGKLTDVLFNGSVYKDDRGNVLGVVIVARDVTAQKLLSKYSLSLIEASLDPLVTISTEGKITDMNEALANITGMTREKLIGTDFFDYFTNPQKAGEVYQEVFAKGSVADSPLTLRHKNGKLTDVLFNGSVYKDDRGNVLGVVIVARDITAQKQASQYARNLIEANLDPLVFISPDGKITDVNEASVIATGIPREQLIGTDFSNYFTDPPKEREAYQQVLKQGFVKDYSLTIRSSNGKLTDVFYNASVYKDTNGNVLGVFAAARDVTAQKKLAEREVVEREKEFMRIAELEKFQKLTVGREIKMIELKKEIEELKKHIGITLE